MWSAARSSCAGRNRLGGAFPLRRRTVESLSFLLRFLSGAKALQRRAGREERCDDREAPDGAKRNRHAPGGSCGVAGERQGGPRGQSRPRSAKKAEAVISLGPLRGEGGIRTREPLWEVTRFPDAPLQPLEHLSFAVCGCKYKQKYVNFVILSGKLISIHRKWLRR